MITEEKKLWAVELLQNKWKELGRLSKKDDFDVVTLSRIKAFLGPWPRALEAAGLKEVTKIPKKPKESFKAVKGECDGLPYRLNIKLRPFEAMIIAFPNIRKS